jgi:hypothetical protein
MPDQYVNDRPYVDSSFMSVAIARVFNSAPAGNSKDRPELVTVPLPLTARVAVLPCRSGEEFLRRLFEPLGYQVLAEHHALDETFPEWGRRHVLHRGDHQESFLARPADPSLGFNSRFRTHSPLQLRPSAAVAKQSPCIAQRSGDGASSDFDPLKGGTFSYCSDFGRVLSVIASGQQEPTRLPIAGSLFLLISLLFLLTLTLRHPRQWERERLERWVPEKK